MFFLSLPTPLALMMRGVTERAVESDTCNQSLCGNRLTAVGGGQLLVLFLPFVPLSISTHTAVRASGTHCTCQVGTVCPCLP
jgi:hypothetical protein